MDPVTIGLVTKATIPVAQGAFAFSQANAQAKQLKKNSFIARTRALQTDTNERTSLGTDLASIRAVLGANSQKPGVGTFEIMNDLRKTRNRERRVQVANQMQQSYDFAANARTAKADGLTSFLLGGVRAGPSLFDLYQYRTQQV